MSLLLKVFAFCSLAQIAYVITPDFEIQSVHAQDIRFEHCQGPEFSTDQYHFRAWMLGESRDPVIARKKALLNAKSELSGNMQAIIKSVLDQYYSSHYGANRLEYLTRELVKQRLNGVRVICRKTVKTANSSFISYVAVELPRHGILADIDEKILSGSKTDKEYDFAEFEKMMGSEMEKSSQTRDAGKIIR